MSIEAVTALIAFLSLVVCILGFVINALRDDNKALWGESKAARAELTAFKEKITDNYATKDFVKDHSSARHELLVESLNNLGREIAGVKRDVESVEAQLRGSNELLPQLLLTLHQIQERIKHDRV